MTDEEKDKIEASTGLCGCGNDESFEMIVAELKSVAAGEYTSDTTRVALRLLMDKLGWITHGISIRASLMLPGDEGLKILEALK